MRLLVRACAFVILASCRHPWSSLQPSQDAAVDQADNGAQAANASHEGTHPIDPGASRPIAPLAVVDASQVTRRVLPLTAGTPTSFSDGTMTLGIDPQSRQVTGQFFQARVGAYEPGYEDDALRFSCELYISGKSVGDHFDISAGPEDSSPACPSVVGTLSVMLANDVYTAEVRLLEEPKCCDMTIGGEYFAGPVNVRADHDARIGVRIVHGDRAPLYQSPDQASHAVGYLVHGDAVSVLETRREWIRASYRGCQTRERNTVEEFLRTCDAPTIVEGWLPANELYPVELPRRKRAK